MQKAPDGPRSMQSNGVGARPEGQQLASWKTQQRCWESGLAWAEIAGSWRFLRWCNVGVELRMQLPALGGGMIDVALHPLHMSRRA
eukprot:scaffold571078_cov20-Prasinocladus_malaysianus.AAC.1